MFEQLIDEINGSYRINAIHAELLKVSENTTLRIDTADNVPYILRINRPSYHSISELESETRWMDIIRHDTDIHVPEVIKNSKGEYVSGFSESTKYGRYYSIFSFISGRDLQAGSVEELKKNIEAAGMTAAKLHKCTINSDQVRQLPRFCWDYEDLLGANPRWGHWSFHPLLSEQEKEKIKSFCYSIKKKLDEYGKGPNRYGMIHGDLHLSNFIETPDKLYLIDYDDCGYGWFLYECGCTLMQYNDPLEELSQSWIRGYTGIRNLSDKDLEMIPVFILMRRIARIGWMASHSSSDTAASVSDFRTYIDVTIDHASALFTAS